MQYIRLSYFFNRYTLRYRDMKPLGIYLLGGLGDRIHNLSTNLLVFTLAGLFVCFIAILFATTDLFAQSHLGVNFIYLGLVLVIYQTTWEGYFDVDLVKKFYRQLALSGYSRPQLVMASVINEWLSYKLTATCILSLMLIWANYTYFGVSYASIWAIGWFIVVHLLFNTVIGLLKIAMYYSPLRTTHYIIRGEILLLIVGAGIFGISVFSQSLDMAFIWFSTILQ